MQPRRIRKTPGHAGINLPADAKRMQSKALNARAGSFSTGDDQLTHAALDERARDPGKHVFNSLRGCRMTELLLHRVDASRISR